MPYTTTQLRQLWGPACKIKTGRVTLYGGAVITVDYRTVPAWQAFSECLRHHDYPAPVTDPITTGAYVCRKITGGSGLSLHSFGIAADIRWPENPYQKPSHYNRHGLKTTMPPAMVDEILSLRTVDGHQVFGWGGNYAVNKDPMHYEIVCSPDQLATGIRSTTPPAPTPGPTPASPTRKDDTMIARLVKRTDKPAIYVEVDNVLTHLTTDDPKVLENLKFSLEQDHAVWLEPPPGSGATFVPGFPVWAFDPFVFELRGWVAVD